MKRACKDCQTRKFFARLVDMHFSGADCWFECEYADDNPKNDIQVCGGYQPRDHHGEPPKPPRSDTNATKARREE